MPGATSMTRSGSPFSSSRSTSVSAWAANFAALYPPPPAYAVCPAIDVTLTMSATPRSTAPRRSSGSSALVTRLRASTLTSNIHAQSSIDDASTESRPFAPPALLTSACSGPGRGEVVAQCVDVGLVGEVGDEDGCPGLGLELAQPVLAAGHADDVPSGGTERAHGRRADPGARTGHDRSQHTHAPILAHARADARRARAEASAGRCG